MPLRRIYRAVTAAAVLLFFTNCKSDSSGNSDDGIHTCSLSDYTYITESAAASELYPSLITSENGFFAGWAASSDGGSKWQIYSRMLDGDLKPATAENRITNTSGSSLYPTFVANGDGFGLFWWENDGTTAKHKYQQLGTDGTINGLAADFDLQATPNIVFNGSEYAAFIFQSKFIYFTRFNRDGTSASKVSAVIAANAAPSVAWNGSNYALTWIDDSADGAQNIYFAEMSPNGELLADAKIIKSGGKPAQLSLVWNGSNYALLWHDTTIYFATLNTQGDFIGMPAITIDNPSLNKPQAVWNGKNWGISMVLSNGPNNYFIEFSNEGQPKSEFLMYQGVFDPVLTARAGHYGILFRSSNRSDLATGIFTCVASTPLVSSGQSKSETPLP